MSVLNHYKSWVKHHPSVVAYLESGLSTLSYLLPDRFQNTEYLYECLNSFLGLASIWHTSILKEDDPNYNQPPSALWLAALQQIETLVELRAMQLERAGKMSRYGPLAVVELLKAVLRLHILSTQSSRLLVNDALHDDMSHQDMQERAAEQRVEQLLRALKRFPCKADVSSSSSGSSTSLQQSFPAPQPSPTKTHITARATTAPPSPNRATTTQQQLRHKCSTPDEQEASPHPSPASSNSPTQDLLWWQIPVTSRASPPENPSCSLPTPSSSSSSNDGHHALYLIQAAELLHIYRPLVYVLLLHKLDRKSWTPWLVSLATDIASSALLSRASAMLRDMDQQGSPRTSALYSLSLLRAFTGFHWTCAEQRELARRKMQLAMYLLRSPFFDAVTARGMYSVQKRMQRIPLVGALGEKLVEIVEGCQQYYTYTSAS